jgi:very-short-patch-repair endonuclease
MKQTTKYARALRKSLTPQERKLWYYLRNRRFGGFKFRRQFPIGPYIVDFCCFSTKLIIELDGGQHNDSNFIIKDRRRDSYLKNLGFTILRFWNNELDNNRQVVLDSIYDQLQILTPSPSPKGEGS